MGPRMEYPKPNTKINLKKKSNQIIGQIKVAVEEEERASWPVTQRTKPEAGELQKVGPAARITAITACSIDIVMELIIRRRKAAH